MSTLTLVRHGQAHPFQREGAALTAIGEAQASALAQYWLRHGVEFDEVYSGALVRQARTEAIVGAAFREAGRPWPAVVQDAAWNEYDAPGVLQHFIGRDVGLTALAAEFEKARGTSEEYRHFQRLFEAAMTQWLEATVETEGVESWCIFQGRVSAAIQRLMAGPPSRRIAIFTSGGPIGFTVQYSLRAPARSFLEVNWRVRNSSISEFVFDRSRITLDSFNALPHLEGGQLRTYR